MLVRRGTCPLQCTVPETIAVTFGCECAVCRRADHCLLRPSLTASAPSPCSARDPLCLRMINMQQYRLGERRALGCRGPAPFTSGCRVPRNRVVRASNDPKDSNELRDKFFGNQPDDKKQQAAPGAAPGFGLIDNVNPYVLGRQARQAFDSVWDRISTLGSPTKSYIFDDVMEATMDPEAAPQAGNTTVLVVGATGRVGRIVLRKLLLRGYKVRALVRPKGSMSLTDPVPGIPTAVDVVFGDVGDQKACQKAIKGVDKVIFCAAARTTLTGDLLRVEGLGVTNIAKALEDELMRRAKAEGRTHSPYAKKEVADFSRIYHQLRWNVDFVGVQSEDGRLGRDVARANLAAAEISENNNLVFEGVLFSRGAVAEVGADLNPVLPGGEQRLAGTEGITLRLKGEGHTYACILTTVEGARYVARFPTRIKWSTIRLPFSLFRPEAEGQPPLVPEQIKHISLRYELRRPTSATALGPAAGAAAAAAGPGAAAGGWQQQQQQQQPGGMVRRPGAPGTATSAAALMEEQMKRLSKFKLEVDWIKALPGGVEPAFVLLSCAGTKRPNLSAEDQARVLAAKRRGEEQLRTSGLGYAIIRPGPLVDEPGGYKALVFDQGDRVTQSVSYADVADICLRTLREPEARNKTFDVCYEYQPDEGLELYELVASIPGKGGNYLAPALSTLQRNT